MRQAHLQGGFFHHPLFYKYSWILLAFVAAIALIAAALLVGENGGPSPYPTYYPY